MHSIVDCRDQRLAERWDLALRRVAELDIEGNVAAFDAHIPDLPGRDEILAGVRVDDALQRIEQRGFGDRHGAVEGSLGGRGV